jgi:hypothetical protein
MSFELRVENCLPTPQLFKDAKATYRPIRYPDVTAWQGWRGRPARGVTLVEYEGHTLIKLRTCSSPDDVSLGVEVICALARSLNKPVWVEDVPADVDFSWESAPAPKRTDWAGFPFRPDQLARWPNDWFDYQSMASLEGLLALKNDQASLISTPGRGALITRRLLTALKLLPARRWNFLKAPTVDDLPFVPGPASSNPMHAMRPVTDYLMWAHPRLMLPVRPRWLRTLASEPLPGSMIGPDAQTLAREPEWLTGDWWGITLTKPVDHSFVTLVPEQRQVVGRAHFVAIEHDGHWVLTPFDAFLATAHDLLERLDAFSWVFDAPRRDDWKALAANLRRPQSPRFAVQSLERETAYQLHVGFNPEHAFGKPERDLRQELRKQHGANDLEGVLAMISRLDDVAPDRPGERHYLRSRAFLEAGDAERALAEMAEAVTWPHQNVNQRAGRLADYAEQLFAADRSAEALAAIEAALAMATSDWRLTEDAKAFRQRVAERATASVVH